MHPLTDAATDCANWRGGPKGSGGPDPEANGYYGFDMDSRAWCDAELLALGYDVPDPVSP